LNTTLFKALLASVPACLLLAWATNSLLTTKSVWSLLQLFGVAGLAIVVLAHVSEGLHLFPVMHWGSPRSVGHYLDLTGALLGVTMLPIGYVSQTLANRR
jgi:uncharacterized membrane protein